MLAQKTEELKSLKAETSSNKAKQNEWIQRLQTKLAGYREEKKSWSAEAGELRGEVNEMKVSKTWWE